MRPRVAATWILAALTSATVCGVPARQIQGSASLTEEEIDVYRGFLDTLGPTLHIKNLANSTIPLDFRGFPEGRPCLKGIELEDTSEPLRVVHAFGPEMVQGRDLYLKDRHKQLDALKALEAGNQTRPQAHKPTNAKGELNFLIFSEIAFDTKHQFAVLKYILVCGSHCDSGGTLVMGKVDGRWAPRRGLACAMFFNNSWSEMPD